MFHNCTELETIEFDFQWNSSREYNMQSYFATGRNRVTRFTIPLRKDRQINFQSHLFDYYWRSEADGTKLIIDFKYEPEDPYANSTPRPCSFKASSFVSAKTSEMATPDQLEIQIPAAWESKFQSSWGSNYTLLNDAGLIKIV